MPEIEPIPEDVEGVIVIDPSAGNEYPDLTESTVAGLAFARIPAEVAIPASLLHMGNYIEAGA